MSLCRREEREGEKWMWLVRTRDFVRLLNLWVKSVNLYVFLLICRFSSSLLTFVSSSSLRYLMCVFGPSVNQWISICESMNLGSILLDSVPSVHLRNTGNNSSSFESLVCLRVLIASMAITSFVSLDCLYGYKQLQYRSLKKPVHIIKLHIFFHGYGYSYGYLLLFSCAHQVFDHFPLTYSLHFIPSGNQIGIWKWLQVSYLKHK